MIECFETLKCKKSDPHVANLQVISDLRWKCKK